MASLSLSAVSASIYAALHVPALTAEVSTRIYDGVPQAPVFPFVTYEVMETDARGLGGGYLPEVELRVHVFSTYAGSLEAQRIGSVIVSLLQDAPLTASGYHQAGLVVYSDTQLLPGQSVNGVVCRELVARFRLWVEA